MTPEKFTKICDKFFVPNIIRNHLLRTAAVAVQITTHCNKEINKELVQNAMLLHDLGNIVKSDVHRFSFFETENEEYWEKKKEEIMKTYGTHDDNATESMLNIIDISQELKSLIQRGKNDKVWEAVEHNDWNAKICLYADYRVGPRSVLSLQERFDDLERRYKEKPPEYHLSNEEAHRIQNGFREVEKQIFAECDISPEDVTETSIQEFLVEPLIETKK